MVRALDSNFIIFNNVVNKVLAKLLCYEVEGLMFFGCTSIVLPSITLTRKFKQVKYFLTNYYCKGRARDIFSIVFRDSRCTPGRITLVPARLCSDKLSFLRFLLLLLVTQGGGRSNRIATYCLVFCDVKQFIVRFFHKSVVHKDIKVLSASRFVDVFAKVTKVILLVQVEGGGSDGDDIWVSRKDPVCRRGIKR